MKKLIIVSMAILFALFNSCSDPFDDSYLMDRIDELTERIEALEDFSDQVQSDIDALQDIIIKLQSAVTVDNIVFGADSYTINFSDGSSITITDGKDGEDGRDGEDGKDGQDGEDGKDGMTPPTIIVIEEDGVYYWGYENPDGSKDFILDNDGNKIPVTAAAPEVRINPDTGNWEISTDGGQTWEDTGMPSVGIGDSLFLDVKEDDDNVYLVLRDGSVIVIPKTKEFSFELETDEDTLYFKIGEQKVVQYKMSGVEDILVIKPDGWRASFEQKGLVITAPLWDYIESTNYYENEGEINIVAISSNGQCLLKRIAVALWQKSSSSNFDMPESWSFRKRALITFATGTWCGYDAGFKAAIKALEASRWSDACIAECHLGDIMDNVTTNEILKLLNINSLPFLNWNFSDIEQVGALDGDIEQYVNLIIDNTNLVNANGISSSGAAITYNTGSPGYLTATADVAFAEKGYYKVNCWLLESGIIANQADSYPSITCGWDIDYHNNVLRGIGNTMDVMGDLVEAEKETGLRFIWNFPADILINKTVEATHVLVVISKREINGDFIVDNVIRCNFNSVNGYDYFFQ